MEQRTFADLEYEPKKRVTRREKFLARMERLIPWEQLEARIRPHYPKAGRGRRPYQPVAKVVTAFDRLCIPAD